jgi:hypothetical protein
MALAELDGVSAWTRAYRSCVSLVTQGSRQCGDAFGYRGIGWHRSGERSFKFRKLRVDKVVQGSVGTQVSHGIHGDIGVRGCQRLLTFRGSNVGASWATASTSSRAGVVVRNDVPVIVERNKVTANPGGGHAKFTR